MKIHFSISVLLCLGFATLFSCAHQAEEHHHHDGAQYTVYSPDFELFAEAEPLVVGEEATVLCHLTRLSDFKPLDSTCVTLRLRVGDSVQVARLPLPQRPGVYRFDITPKVAGCALLQLDVATADSVATLAFPHLHVFSNKEAAEGHAHHHHGHSHCEESHQEAEGIVFTKEQSWKVDFAVEQVSLAPFGSVLKATAQVLPSQGDEREAPAKASGIVLFSHAGLVEGTFVKAGQPLFSIESSGMADNNMLVKFQEASANYNAAKADYERKQPLAQDRIVSQHELERSRSAYESAKAVYDNLKGNFSQKGAVVTAPISGYVKRIAVRNGAYVEAGQPVVTIAQNRDLFIRAEVQPRYYQALQHILTANIELPDNGGIYALEDLGGALIDYGRSVDAEHPLIPVTFRLNNRAQLVAGSFVTLYIRSASESEVVTLPNTGIVEEMGNYFVFVQRTPERFEKRLVTLGGSDGLRTVIASGLQPGERVVSKGAVMVKLAQNTGTLDPHAGHVH